MNVIVLGLGFAFVLTGCVGVPSPPPLEGVVWLSWTISGEAVSDTVCADIDHLVITIESSPSVGVEIEPVPCARGASWERDDVPEGSDTILLDAVDSSGQTIFESVSMIGVTESKPATATLVDLQPL